MTPLQTVRQRLSQGMPVFGCWLASASSEAAEIIGHTGFDFVMIDQEHGSADHGALRGMLQALAATPTAALVRVPAVDAAVVKRVLDQGADGILFPNVRSVAQAAQAVAACRYPPQGQRGYGIGLARAGTYGINRDAYVADQAAAVLVICQIESREGVDAIGGMAALSGLDGLFIGPYDLSASLGRLADFAAPEVAGLLAEAKQTLNGCGRFWGCVPYPGCDDAALVAQGCRMVIAGSDIGFLREGAIARADALRRLRQSEAGS